MPACSEKYQPSNIIFLAKIVVFVYITVVVEAKFFAVTMSGTTAWAQRRNSSFGQT